MEAPAWFVEFTNEIRAANNRYFIAMQNLSERISELQVTITTQYVLSQNEIWALREEIQLLLMRQSHANECVEPPLQ